MTRRVPSLLAALALLTAAAPAPAAERLRDPIRLDRVVAVVNSEVITRLELDDQVRLATRELNRQGTPMPRPDQLERQLLERMITTRVLLQFARETGLRVDDAQVDRALGRVADQNKLTLPQLREVLAQDGVDYNRYREDLRSDIIVARLREREVDSRLTVSDAEVDVQLRNQAASGRNDEYSLLHILVTVPEAATPEQLGARKARAEEALARLREGADFLQISSVYSDAPNALQGGDLGWRPLGRLPTLFAQAAAAMKTGDLAGPLRSPNGFHILKLVDKRAIGQQVVVERSRTRHILVRLNEVVSEQEARRRLAEIRARVVAGADFAELARTQSEDATAARGGELGWVAPGDTVPEFEQVVMALAPGEVSQPVQTPFGWHLIQVMERRTEDMTEERQRQMARQAIRSRKAEEAFTDWIRQQRDRAFIEQRLEER